MEPKTPHVQQEQGGGHPFSPIEQQVAVELAAPAMEELPVTGLTSPGGEVHDKGDPGDEGLLATRMMPADTAEAGAEAIGDALSTTAREPPTVAEQMMAPTTSTAEARPRQPV